MNRQPRAARMERIVEVYRSRPQVFVFGGPINQQEAGVGFFPRGERKNFGGRPGRIDLDPAIGSIAGSRKDPAYATPIGDYKTYAVNSFTGQIEINRCLARHGLTQLLPIRSTVGSNPNCYLGSSGRPKVVDQVLKAYMR